MVLGGIIGFLGLVFLFDIATEMTKVRKLLENQAKQESPKG